MPTDNKIEVSGLWKRYGIPVSHAMRDWITRLSGHGTRGSEDTPGSAGSWALRNINFSAAEGEMVGVIGRNGAGKSTLLKVLAGVTPPTRGSVSLDGRIFPMIELGAGLHTELTGKENIYLSGAIMGLKRREVAQKYRKIEEFSGLGDWLERPVRTYSSGMLARLGFSVAMNVDADILLIDEVLSVGDVAFQNRCLEALKGIRGSGKTIVFVSHSLEQVQYLCQKVVLVENGEVADTGNPEEIITKYENLQYGTQSAYKLSQADGPGSSPSGHSFILKRASVLNPEGEEKPPEVDAAGNGISVRFECATAVPTDDLLFTFAILNHRRERFLWEVIEGKNLSRCDSGDFELVVHVPPVPLSGGSYTVNFAVRNSHSYETLVRRKGLAPFRVGAAKRERGMFTLPLEWDLKQP